ncbi:MAG TPA: NADH-quinone oxidoreductase subunit J [Chthonomonadaceae bacterium]|nr:NADH-quinone oxidoreductase subunit J [Chthonomonadaceae bacterium]
MIAEPIIFWIMAVISVVAAILMVANRNPVRSALFLVATFLCVAVLYLALTAQFIAAIQIIVYAGAIMVLFLFVIMLLNLGAPQALRERGTIQPFAAVGLGLLFIIALLGSESLIRVPRPAAPANPDLGTVQSVGLNLFAPTLPWLFPFEVTSILLLVAIVGAIIMAKRRV